jgi:hypothetical protein
LAFFRAVIAGLTAERTERKYIKQQIHLFAVGIAFLGVIKETDAGCPDGARRPCVINGKPGIQECGLIVERR